MPTDVYYSTKDATDSRTDGSTAAGTIMSATNSVVDVRSWMMVFKSSYSYQSYRGLFQYNITLPASAVVSAVTGYVFCASAQDNASQQGIQKLTSAWAETEGSTSPSFDATVLATFMPVNASWNTFSSAALTALVQGWVNGTIPNYGLRIIRNPDNFGGAQYSNTYAAKEYGGYTSYLSITYVTNQVPTAPTGLAAGASLITGQPVSWTHNDPNGNPQAQFQVRWRRAD